MGASAGIPVSHFNRAGWRKRRGQRGTHAVATAAPITEHPCAKPPQPNMRRGDRCDPPQAVPLALTGKQRIALSLANAGLSHAEVASRMGLAHRVTATKLIRRARAADKLFREAVVNFIGE